MEFSLSIAKLETTLQVLTMLRRKQDCSNLGKILQTENDVWLL